MQILCVHHDKGGVGKTTSVQNLGMASARNGNRTLLIDLDGQGSLTEAFGANADADGTVEVLEAEMKRKSIQLPTQTLGDKLDLLAGRYDLFSIAEEIDRYRGKRELLVTQAIEPHRTRYDTVIIDTPPGAGWLVFNAIIASNQIIAPVQCEALSIRGISDFAQTITELSEQYQIRIKLSAIFPTFVNGSRAEHQRYLEALRKKYGSLMTQTVIRQDANLARAQTQKCSIYDLDPKSRAALDYQNLGKELGLWSDAAV